MFDIAYILFFYCTQIYQLPKYKWGPHFPFGKDWSRVPWEERAYIFNIEPGFNCLDQASGIKLKTVWEYNSLWAWVPFNLVVSGPFHTRKMH